MPNVAGDSYSRAVTYLYTSHICQFASAFREKVKEDEAASENKSDKVKYEFDKVKDDLLLWIKEAPVLQFRKLKPDEFTKRLVSTWNIFVDKRTSATMFQVDGPLYEWIMS